MFHFVAFSVVVAILGLDDAGDRLGTNDLVIRHTKIYVHLLTCFRLSERRSLVAVSSSGVGKLSEHSIFVVRGSYGGSSGGGNGQRETDNRGG